MSLRERYDAAFDGTVKRSNLVVVPADFSVCGTHHVTFRCPCGGKNHYATRAVGDVVSDVLHCWETGKQWMIVDGIAGVIEREERQFIQLIEKHEKSGIVGKLVSAAEAFRLYTERGLPPELIEIDDTAEFDRLMQQHRRQSA